MAGGRGEGNWWAGLESWVDPRAFGEMCAPVRAEGRGGAQQDAAASDGAEASHRGHDDRDAAEGIERPGGGRRPWQDMLRERRKERDKHRREQGGDSKAAKPETPLAKLLRERKEIGHTLEQQLGHRQSQATQRRLRAHVRWLGLSRKAIATARKVEEAKKQWEEEQKEANTVQLLVQLRGITLDPKDSSLFHGASSDPYLIFLQLGKEIGRTEVIHKNLNPFWDAVKLVAQNHHPLTIQCWDYDAMSKDDIIGQCKVEIHELVAGHFMELSIADTTAPTGRKSTGKLKVLSLMVMDKKAMAESAKHLVTASMVWRAEELLAADTGIFQSASSDPYLVFHQMGKEIGRTNVVERDLNPTWDRIRLVLYANADVQIRCYDQDFLSADDLIGEVTVMGQDLLQPHTTLHLTNKNNEAILEQKGHRGSGKYGRLIVDDVYWYFNNGVSAKKAAEDPRIKSSHELSEMCKEGMGRALLYKKAYMYQQLAGQDEQTDQMPIASSDIHGRFMSLQDVKRDLQFQQSMYPNKFEDVGFENSKTLRHMRYNEERTVAIMDRAQKLAAEQALQRGVMFDAAEPGGVLSPKSAFREHKRNGASEAIVKGFDRERQKQIEAVGPRDVPRAPYQRPVERRLPNMDPFRASCIQHPSVLQDRLEELRQRDEQTRAEKVRLRMRAAYTAQGLNEPAEVDQTSAQKRKSSNS